MKHILLADDNAIYRETGIDALKRPIRMTFLKGTPAIRDPVIIFFITLKEKAHDMRRTGPEKMIHITTDLTHILNKNMPVKVHDALEYKQVVPLLIVVILQADAPIGLVNLKISAMTRDLDKRFVDEEKENTDITC